MNQEKNNENITWLRNTPVGYNIRELSFVAPHRHEDLIELTMCLKGEVKFSYIFEEFTLREGEFILVDKDVHYLYGKGAICASVYLDLNCFEEKYPYVKGIQYICEGTRDSAEDHNTYYHKNLKALLLALFWYIQKETERDAVFSRKVCGSADKIIETLIEHFDTVFYYHPDAEIKPAMLQRYQKMEHYIYQHFKEKVSLTEYAGYIGLSNTYASEISNMFTGFRGNVNYLRANESQKYLIETDFTATYISELCGFSDAKYYYSAFKKWYNCTPGEYRKKYCQEMSRKNTEKPVDPKEITRLLAKMIDEHFEDMFL